MITGPPIIHEAITLSPDPTEFMPVEVSSAFPKGAQSRLTSAEKAKIDDLIEGVPDKNDTRAINYWRDMDDKKVYLEGWCDKCLAGTGFPPMEGGEWDEKIQYMLRDTHRTLIAKQEERNRPPGIGPGYFTLIEGGFREFEAGDRAWLYGVTWGIYEKTEGGNPLITDVDTCLREIADWYVKNRREITETELKAILWKHCESEAEVKKFIKFLETESGQMRFKTLLRERKEVEIPEGGFWLGIAGAERKFPLGQIVMTRGVNDLVAENVDFAKFATESLRRHARGDWGDLSEEDKRENEYALGRRLRLFSAYERYPLPKIWIITEADRSATTILFPEEY